MRYPYSGFPNGTTVDALPEAPNYPAIRFYEYAREHE